MILPSHRTTRTLFVTLLVLCCAAIAPAVGHAAEEGAEPAPPAEDAAEAAPVLRAAGVRGPLGDELLSDERTVTRHAEARWESPIYRRPTSASPRAGALRFMTEDGYPEVYLVLESRVDEHDQVWLRIRIPGRPNGRVGWVRDTKLGGLRVVDTFLHVRRGRDARLYRGDRIIWQARVGTGATRTPTPAGRFWIREKFRGTGGIYGPWVFGTSAYSVLSDWPRGGVIGIHGTNQPGLIPGRPSKGCIRLRNAHVTQLYRLMPVGTPLLIT